MEKIDRHLLLAPLLPRLCPGLLLVDTTLSAGLLALLSCWEMVWMQDVMRFIKNCRVVKPAGSLSKLQFRHRSPHHLRQLDLEAISILPTKCCFLKELISCCLSLLLSFEHQCELGT